MKNNKNLRRTILSTFIIKLILVSLVYFGLLLIFGISLRDFTAQILRNIFGLYVYRIYDFKYAIIIVAFIIIAGFIIVQTVLKSISYLEIMSNSIDKVFLKNEDFVVLPRELKDIESKLNTIKYTSIKNEQAAREAEQKKNDLVVYLAHDLKTPLTSIIGYLSLLEEAPDMPTQQKSKYTSIALDKAYRLEQLINEFFDITRFNLQNISLDNNKINLSLMIHQMIDEFYPMLNEKGITPCISIDDDIIFHGDSDKLARVFDNLLRNGVNYSYDNTVLEVSASINYNNISISFKNKGDEIPQHKIDSIFEKFFRLDNARRSTTGGAGLGLAIAKQIVELHKGTISVTSNQEYTEFIVLLPKS